MFIIAFGVIKKDLLSATQQVYQGNWKARAPRLTLLNMTPFLFLEAKTGLPKALSNPALIQGSDCCVVYLFTDAVPCWKSQTEAKGF